MNRYFIDTEFIEGFHKPFFRKRRHFIDLISIGIKAEDGREYYAISNEFNSNDADIWVQDNVINLLPEKNISFNDSPRMKEESLLWKSNKQIAEEIINFVAPPLNRTDGHMGYYSIEDYLKSNPPEFYAYYADYDWVVFCSLFGRMIDLPKGFPMYCKDLKQILDEKVSTFGSAQKYGVEHTIKELKTREDFPKQENEHSAIDDAKWNFELYKFLQKL